MVAFDPMAFFRLASELASESGSEAKQRAAIGRAYYACHLTARDRLYGLEGRGLTSTVKKRFGRGAISDHSAVELAIAQNRRIGSSGRAKRLSDRLGQLQEMREMADYKLDTTGTAVTDVFAKHRVKDWDGLARVTLALATNLLPELHLLRS